MKNDPRTRTNFIYSMRPTLGYDRYGYQVTFRSTPESRFRDRIFPTVETPCTHVRQNLIISTIVFIAGHSSNITCPHLGGTCEPSYKLGMLFILSAPILARKLGDKLESGWWNARRGAEERRNIFILAPRMCRRELKKRVNGGFPPFGEHGWGGILSHNPQMQKGGLLWGCPWKPTLDQVKSWIR